MSNARRNLRLEKLEVRQFLSASLTNSGQLIVAGDQNSANDIVVGMSADGASVDVQLDGGAVQAFDASSVKSVVLIGGAEGDTITIDESNSPFTINTKIFGEGGADSITAGSENGYIAGGAGADTIKAASGNEVILGKAGADSILAGSGNDSIYGGKGADHIEGGSGDDLLDGNKGPDSLTGGDGTDTIVGGRGHDTLDAGSGGDLLIGGKGHDQCNGGSGHDTVAGNAGDDEINPGSGGVTTQDGAPSVPDAPLKDPPVTPPTDTNVGIVTGTVTDSNGQPVANATVVLATTLGPNGGYSIAGSFGVGTDANGNFEFDNIPAGDYVLLSGKHGVGFVQTTVTVTADQTTNVPLQLKAFAHPDDGGPGTVSGIVSDSNSAPLAGATVTLVSESGDNPSSAPKTTTDANGAFSFASVPAGEYTVVVVDPGVGYAHVETTVASNQTDTVNVTVTTVPPPVADGGTVSGVVTDANGNPVANASMGLEVQGADGFSFYATTDANGNFSVMVPAGTYTIMTGKHGVGRATVDGVVVTTGATTTENIQLTAETTPTPPNPDPTPVPTPTQGVTISGQVFDTNDSPVASVSIGLATADSVNAGTPVFVTGGSSASDGTFSISNVAPGQYYLFAGKKGVGSDRMLITVSQDGSGNTGLVVTLTLNAD